MTPHNTPASSACDRSQAYVRVHAYAFVIVLTLAVPVLAQTDGGSESHDDDHDGTRAGKAAAGREPIRRRPRDAPDPAAGHDGTGATSPTPAIWTTPPPAPAPGRPPSSFPRRRLRTHS